MATITAAEASRNFSAVLDRAERGEAITIVRHGRNVATIGPAPVRTGRDLRRALENADSTPDNDLAADIARGLSSVSQEIRDPWADN